MENVIKYIHETISRLSHVTEPLERILKDVEPYFLQLGQELQGIYSDTEKLTRLSNKTAQIAGGDSSDGFLTNVEALAEQSLEKFERCRIEISGSLQYVETSVQYLDKFQKFYPVIRSISKSLNIIALNIAMESSRSQEGEEMFSFFVREIRDLSKRVNEISRQIRDDSERARLTQANILESVMERRDALTHIAAAAHRMVKDSVKRIENLLNMSAIALEKAGKCSGEISRNIGEVVTSIQFHDISRQQIEHVIEAIRDIEKKCREEISQQNVDTGGPEVLSEARSVLRVQEAQMEQVIREIREAHDRIASSYGEIGHEIEILVEETANLWSTNSNYLDKENAMEALVSGYVELNRILEQGHDLVKQVEKAMLSSSEVASRLTLNVNRIEDISFDLHLKAINAVIMSNRLGEKGKAQSVLAQDVTEISKKSNTFASQVVDIIRSISELAYDLSSLSKDNVSDDKTGMDMEQIMGAYRNFQKDSSLTVERAGSLKEMISQCKTRLSFFMELIDQLTVCLSMLKEIIQLLEPFTIQKDEQGSDFDQTSKRYTMEIERNIHADVFSYKDDADLYEDTKEKKEYNDLGDNVELF